jgi:propionyl-CoA synthetase
MTTSNLYPSTYAQSLNDPAGFWLEAARLLDWTKPPQTAFTTQANGMADWFADGELNVCDNAVDRHVRAGNGERVALIHDSAMTGEVRTITYAQMQDQVARTAGMLAALGVGKGDRVLIYMPMVPEAVFAMLACARLGAIHSVVFGGFASAELAKRVDDATPKVIMSASCGLEPNRVLAYKPLLNEALRLATHQVPHCLILQRPQLAAELRPGRDLDWQTAFAAAAPAPCVPLAATDPLYILYTSGTTGIPKGVVHDSGGYAVALAWSLPNIYGVQPGETFWAASDIGWAVGHSYITYGPLLLGCTSVMYEGKPVGTPDPGAFWRVIRQHKVSVFFTAPTAIRAIKREDPEGKFIAEHGIGGLRALFLAGERADPDTVQWAQTKLGVPVVDHWWQTELGWPALAVCLGLGARETRLGSAGMPIPGYRFAVLDSVGQKLPAGETGAIVIELPLAPGALTTLWQREEHFVSAYLTANPGYYTTGDAGFGDEDGFVHIMSRMDDIINVAGHRLSTGGIEQIIAAHPDVAECAVVGAADAIKGMIPVGLIVLKANVTRPPADVCREVVERVRKDLGPVAAFKYVAVTSQLPKTRSGKILRATIRAIADGHDPAIPATIEEPRALDAVRAALATLAAREG